MPASVDESDVRKRCTGAVFERGESYREEGRVRRLSRFGETVTARVRGTRTYEVSLDLSKSTVDPRCTCPYDGPGDCKHAVAVLLELADGLPPDAGDRVDSILGEARTEDLSDFLCDELARDPRTRERFFARFGETVEKSEGEYREEIDWLFEERLDEHRVVVEAIDFSRFTELAASYRERGNYRQAATIYRALAEGIDENMHLVDAAFDHYAQSFSAALDAYVECVSMADIEPEERREPIEFLSERADAGTDSLRERYGAALADLRARGDDHPE